MVGKELCLCCGLKSLPLLETDWIYELYMIYPVCIGSVQPFELFE
jgi:hypothetical protein